MIDARDTLLERMKVDLIGPESPDELISDRPTDRYLTGCPSSEHLAQIGA